MRTDRAYDSMIHLTYMDMQLGATVCAITKKMRQGNRDDLTTSHAQLTRTTVTCLQVQHSGVFHNIQKPSRIIHVSSHVNK